jgi:hypothetical protein
MTAEECVAACIEADYAFFGLAGSDVCMCGSRVAVNSSQVAAARKSKHSRQFVRRRLF